MAENLDNGGGKLEETRSKENRSCLESQEKLIDASRISPSAESAQQSAIQTAIQTEQEVKKGVLPACELIQEKPSSNDAGKEIESNQVLSPEQLAEQKIVGSFYQAKRLLPSLEQITPKAAAGEDQNQVQNEQARQELIKKRREGILNEMSLSNPEKWIWGPNSQAALKDYLEMIQEQAFPSLIRELASHGASPPAGMPAALPEENGHRLLPSTYQSQLISGERALDLQIDPGKPPMKNEAQKIENALESIGRMQEQINSANLRKLDEQLTQLIIDRKLPNNWLYKEGQDKAAWREAAQEMIEMTLQIGRSISISEKLKLPINYPPGTELIKTEDGGLVVKLDLPQDLRLKSPANAEKINRLLEFNKLAQIRVEKAVHQFESNHKSPITNVSWGDMNIPMFKDANGQEHPTQGVFEKSKEKPGKLIGFVQAYKDKNGEWLQADGTKFDLPHGQMLSPVNLMEQRPQIDTMSNGDIQVSFNTRAQNVPWYGYQNLVAVENVGEPAGLNPIQYKPDDIVALGNGAASEFILAKDLKSKIDLQSTLYRGQKALMLTMDAAMFATGTVEIAAAVKGASWLASGAEAIGELKAKQLAMYAGKGAFDSSLGLLDTDNAYFTSFESGRNAIAIRSGLFLASMTPAAYALVRDSAAVFSAAVGINSTIEAAEILKSENEAMQFQQLVESSGKGFALSADIAGKAMGYAQIPMAPMIGHGLIEGVKDLWTGTDPYAAYSAVVQFESSAKNTPRMEQDTDGIGKNATMTFAATREARRSKPEEAEKAQKAIEIYHQMLGSKIPSYLPEKSAQIADIFQSLKQALAPDSSHDMQEALKRKLAEYIVLNNEEVEFLEQAYKPKLSQADLANLLDPERRMQFPSEKVRTRAENILALKKTEPKLFSDADIKYMQMAYHAKLSSEQIHDLMDPEKRKQFPDEAVRERANTVMSRKDPDLLAASEIALMYLHKQTGKPGERDLAKVSFANGVELTLDQKLLADSLKQRLESTSHDLRGIAIADILTRLGELSANQYGAVLQDLLVNKDSSVQDKLDVLSNESGSKLATVFGTMYLQEHLLANDKNLTDETRRRIAVSNFGISTKDLENTLKTLAISDNNLELRAISASLLYLLKELSFAPIEGARFLDQVNAASSKEHSFTLSSTLAKMLTHELASSPENIEKRLAALEAISALCATMPADEATRLASLIPEAIAESISLASINDLPLLVSAMPAGAFEKLALDNPELSARMQTQILRLLQQTAPLNHDASFEKKQVELLKALPAPAACARADQQQALFASLKNLIEKSPSYYYDMRAAAVEASVFVANSTDDSMPFLRELAESDQYASVRQAAWRALAELKDPELAARLPKLIEDESDLAVAITLRDIQFGLFSAQVQEKDPQQDQTVAQEQDQEQEQEQEQAKLKPQLQTRPYNKTSHEFEAFQADISKRYPDLQSFDDQAQKEWILQHFPLLDGARFVDDLLKQTKDKLNNFVFNTAQDAGNELVEERSEQFRALSALARSDASSADTQKARQILCSIIANQGKSINLPKHWVYLGERFNFNPQAPRPFDPDFSNFGLYYNEKADDWTTRAAEALSYTAGPGNNGLDLSARLISTALATGVQGDAQKTLLNAWQKLNPQQGKRSVSEALYQQILSLGVPFH